MVGQKTLASHAKSCGFEWGNGAMFGCVISSLWNGKVVKSRSTRSDPGYENIRPITTKFDSYDDQRIEILDEISLPRLQRLCFNRPNWITNVAPGGEVISFVKIPGTADADALHFEGRPILCEVLVSLRQSITKVRTHGDPLLFENVFEQFVPVSVKGVDTIIRLVDAASICLGNAVKSDHNKDLLKPRVLNSKLVTVTFNNFEIEKRLISTSCLLLQFGVKACENCQYVFKLWNTRERKRRKAEEAEKIIQNGFINERCLTRRGLEAKLLSQKTCFSKTKRPSKCENQTELEKKDAEDMKDVMNGITFDQVPTNMKLLWEMQLKQLSVKSSNGRRWDPRFDVLILP